MDGPRKNHHFVPQSYIRRFSTDGRGVWIYRTLVSRDSVPHWKEHSIRAVASREHLYTRIVGDSESDELERWFGEAIESPAREAVDKATSSTALTRSDWNALIRLFAAQDLRTPTSLLTMIKNQTEWFEKHGKDALAASVQKLETLVREGVDLSSQLSTSSAADAYEPPLRISRHVDHEGGQGFVRADLTVGRSLWLWHLRRQLQSLAPILLQHRWCIRRTPQETPLFTSDRPVMKLNCWTANRYNLQGGWAQRGTELMLPLSPRHLMYTQVGNRDMPKRDAPIPPSELRLLRRFLAKNAHRLIIAQAPDSTISSMRPRVVDHDRYRAEAKDWNDWHRLQSAAERGADQEFQAGAAQIE